MKIIQKLIKQIKRNQEVLFARAKEFEQTMSAWEIQTSVVSYHQVKESLKKHEEVFKIIEDTQHAANQIVEEMEIIKSNMTLQNEEDEDCLSRFLVVTDYYILICDRFHNNFKASYDKFAKYLKPHSDIESLIDMYDI